MGVELGLLGLSQNNFMERLFIENQSLKADVDKLFAYDDSKASNQRKALIA